MREAHVGGTRLVLIRGDITEQQVDAVVNAANSSLLGGGGVDGAIHRRGGPAILAACRALRQTRYPDGLPTGEAVATTAGKLPARHVIHVVGPVWSGGDRGEGILLAAAYRNSLEAAKGVGARSVAFPSISTGAYGYPVASAARTAIATVLEFVQGNAGAFEEIRLVLFSAADFDLYARALDASGASGAGGPFPAGA